MQLRPLNLVVAETGNPPKSELDLTFVRAESVGVRQCLQLEQRATFQGGGSISTGMVLWSELAIDTSAGLGSTSFSKTMRCRKATLSLLFFATNRMGGRLGRRLTSKLVVSQSSVCGK